MTSGISLNEKQQQAANWFKDLRDQICTAFEAIENDYDGCFNDKPAGKFEQTSWDRTNQDDGAHGGGGVMSVMKGRVFEKVGVNISSVHGTFTQEFAKNIPGASEDPRFFATGISLVAHMHSAKVPAVHMNTRYIVTTKDWFGGGADLNSAIPNKIDTESFHQALKQACDKHDPSYYDKYKKWCDEYFYVPHRNRARGEGGIFYDRLNSGSFDKDFAFTQEVGRAFLDVYPKLVRNHMNESWSEEDREALLIYRGLYAEFNLVYDRGTTFGLKTGGNVEAILMSLPPEAKWP